jgi:hypothetical protein
MIVAAALGPAPPLLVPALTGAGPADDAVLALRAASRAAVGELIEAGPEVIAVVGAAGETVGWDPGARLHLADFAPGPGATRPGSARLPASVGLGSWLLSELGYTGRRLLRSVSAREPADRCAKIGADLAAWPERTGLLVLADGSARRGVRAPGYVDPRSAGFDAEVERAVRDGDLGALLAIEAGLACELMATGRPAWQVLAGALSGQVVATEIRYCDDPFGVAYLVASIRILRAAGGAAEISAGRS